MKYFTSLVVGLLLVLFAPLALSQPQKVVSYADKEKAKALAKSGDKAFRSADYEKALKSYQEAYALNPSINYTVSIGQCQSNLGNYEAAIAAYNIFLQGAEPDHPIRPKVAEKVLEAQEALRKQRQEETSAATSSGESAFSAADYEKALSAFQRAYDLTPSAALRYKMAQCHERLRRYQDALTLAEAVRQDPAADKPLQEEARRLLTLLREEQAGVASAAGQHLEALALYRALYEEDAEPAWLFEMGLCHEALGQSREARGALQTFLEKARADDSRRSRAEAALTRLTQAAALDRAARAASAFSAKEYDAALAALQEAYSLAPTTDLLFSIGECYRALGKKAEALSSYQAFLAQAPPGDPKRVTAEERSQALQARADTPAPQETQLPRRLLVGAGVSAGLSAAAGAVILYSTIQINNLTGEVPLKLETILQKQQLRKVMAPVADSFLAISLLCGASGIILKSKTKNKSLSLSIQPTGTVFSVRY